MIPDLSFLSSLAEVLAYSIPLGLGVIFLHNHRPGTESILFLKDSLIF